MKPILEATAGFLLLLVGAVLAFPGVPGPGIPIMLLGLALLARHFHWARRTLEWARAKYQKVKDAAVRRSGRTLGETSQSTPQSKDARP
jgi:hypothetical protein